MVLVQIASKVTIFGTLCVRVATKKKSHKPALIFYRYCKLNFLSGLFDVEEKKNVYLTREHLSGERTHPTGS